jgi:hypothetical protein
LRTATGAQLCDLTNGRDLNAILAEYKLAVFLEILTVRIRNAGADTADKRFAIAFQYQLSASNNECRN